MATMFLLDHIDRIEYMDLIEFANENEVDVDELSSVIDSAKVDVWWE
jgi:hypothetical protein